MPQRQRDGDGLRIATTRENANVVDERVQVIADKELIDKKLDKSRRPAQATRPRHESPQNRFALLEPPSDRGLKPS
jgi:hypothetical protein